MQPGAAVDPGKAQALERAESDCARHAQHAVAQRVEGETVYNCAEGD